MLRVTRIAFCSYARSLTYFFLLLMYPSVSLCPHLHLAMKTCAPSKPLCRTALHMGYRPLVPCCCGHVPRSCVRGHRRHLLSPIKRLCAVSLSPSSSLRPSKELLGAKFDFDRQALNLLFARQSCWDPLGKGFFRCGRWVCCAEITNWS